MPNRSYQHQGPSLAWGLISLAKAIDHEIQEILAVRNQQSPLSQERVDEAFTFDVPLTEQVTRFASEILEHGDENAIVPLRSARVHLSQFHEDISVLHNAVEWANRYTAIAWWLRERQEQLGISEYTVLSTSGSIGNFDIESKSAIVNTMNRLIADDVIEGIERNIDLLGKIRMLHVPAGEGTGPTWNPITLGHEVAHLRFTETWALGWLKNVGPGDLPDLARDAVRLAEQLTLAEGSEVPTPWFQALVNWLVEVACDATLAFFYGDEGIAALSSHLSVHARLDDSPSHPSPLLRLAVQAATSKDDLERFKPDIANKNDQSRRLSAFAELAISCRDDVLGQLAGEVGLDKMYSDEVRSSALVALEGRSTPPSQSWDLDRLRESPSSIECGLVRALWQRRMARLSEPSDSRDSFRTWASEESIDLQLIEHAIDSLQFATRFEAKRRELGVERTDRIPNVLWISPSGVQTSEYSSDGATSCDLRLGRFFIVFKRNEISGLNVLSELRQVRAIQSSVEVGWGQFFVLHPGELVLAVTFERIHVTQDATAQVLTRSSLGRMGLLSATAVQVQPGFRGCLTLELVNLASVPLNLWPGQRIAQIVPLPAIGDAEPYAGHYQDAGARPIFSAAVSDWESTILREIRDD